LLRFYLLPEKGNGEKLETRVLRGREAQDKSEASLSTSPKSIISRAIAPVAAESDILREKRNPF
jgi:hypothetical protein